MPASYKFLLLLLTVSSFAFGQNTPEQKDSIGKSLVPIEGKAIVYFLRPTSYGALIKMSIECDSVHIGATKAGRYVYDIIAPGKHTFTSKSENDATFDIELEGGKIYYIKQQVKMGMLYAETGLKLLDEKDGKKFLGKCKLAKDNVYSN